MIHGLLNPIFSSSIGCHSDTVKLKEVDTDGSALRFLRLDSDGVEKNRTGKLYKHLLWIFHGYVPIH